MIDDLHGREMSTKEKRPGPYKDSRRHIPHKTVMCPLKLSQH